MFKVAFLQTKILRYPFIGFLHALVWWGFIVILLGSIEMIIDGLFGTDRIMAGLGVFYDVITALGDISAFVIAIIILVFLGRRLFHMVKRFTGVEMKKISKMDANTALLIIFLLMISLLGMNAFYILSYPQSYEGYFPVSIFIAGWFPGLSVSQVHLWHEVNWWVHILWIFVFANILPYSKHFHVFMSVPNVFLSRLDSLGHLTNMDNVTKEVKMMMDPDQAFAAPEENIEEAERFGVLDANDVTWKNYFDSLACTECGRCTASCPAAITGKMLSPRKIMIDLRARVKEKGKGIIKNGKEFDDQKSLIRSYISEEELWACTTCNACAQECPVNINHPTLIVDMRRYLVMEEAAAPSGLNVMFTNIENNGAPWQFSPEDRMLWADGLDVKTCMEEPDEKTEYLLWVGCSGSFDDRAKKITRALVKIFNELNINYKCLGSEETCCGDPARRSGNEMLYQMQALTVIETLNMYKPEKIIAICPHCYNIFKNDYPDLEGNFDVIHHSTFLQQLIDEGKLKVDSDIFKELTITFHDPCYLGRCNKEYDSSRKVLKAVDSKMIEMPRNKSNALCCGGGGGQMFKEAEKGDKEVYEERTEEVFTTGADIVATSCPYCATMLTDGIKYKDKQEEVRNLDIAEIIAEATGL
jgi:Fe-S oxidoreductase